MNLKFNSVTLFLYIFLMGCSSNEKDAQPEIRPATSVTVIDLANYKDARDMRVSFSKPSLDNIDNFRIYIVPAALSATFDSLAALANTNYHEVSRSADTDGLKFPASLLDSNGDPIEEGVSYVIFVLSKATDESGLNGILSSPSPTIVLQQISVVRTLTESLSGGSGGMDVDAAGNIYMADFGATLSGNPVGDKVYKISPQGSSEIFATGLIGASGNDFDADGNLLQSNIVGGTVSKIAPDGTVTTLATGFSSPVGITVAPSGDFFVCNCGNNTISKVTSDGIVSEFASSTLMNCPNGIDMDQDGNLYVASFNSPNIVKITPDGTASVLATVPGNNNGHLLINGDFIYVISRGLHQLHRVSFDGQVSLFAGNGLRGIVDGPLTEASFSLPNDLAFSPDGRLIYINDVNGSSPDPSIISPTIIRVIDLAE